MKSGKFLHSGRLLAASLAGLLSASPGLSLAANFQPVLAQSQSDTISLNEAVIARYSSNRIVWDAKDGYVYSLFRVENGQSELLASGLDQGSYIDESAGVGSHCQYVLEETPAAAAKTFGSADESLTSRTALFSAESETGLEALKENAVFVWQDDTLGSENRKVFSGSAQDCIVLDEQQNAAIQALTSGTVIARAQWTDTTNAKGALLGFANNNFIGGRLSGTSGPFAGVELPGGNMMGTNNTSADFRQTTRTMAYTSPTSNSGIDDTVQCLYIDGVKVLDWGASGLGDKYLGFLSALSGQNAAIGGCVSSSGSVTYGWKGTIDFVIITEEVLTKTEMALITEALPQPVSLFTKLTDSNHGRNWILTGGDMAQGSLDDLKTWRNYAGLFEEVIRYDQASSSSFDEEYAKRSRHVINTAYASQTIADLAENYAARIGDYQPAAAAIMLDGNEALDDAQVLNALKTIIAANVEAETATVLQIPFTTDGSRMKTLAQQAMEQTGTDAYSVRILDHSTVLTSSDLTADGSLNASGHLKVCNQLTQAFFGANSKIGANARNRQTTPLYVQSDEEVTLTLSPSGQLSLQGDSSYDTWKVMLNDTVISGDLDNGTAVLAGVKEGDKICATLYRNDGIQSQVARKVVQNGSLADEEVTLSSAQQELADRMASGEDQTWLFMGDSITHGIVYTYGYDSFAQIVEKYVKSQLDRPGDIFINTAVSSADFETTRLNWTQRYARYADQADIVVLMLGTNDAYAAAWDNTAGQFTNLEQKVAEYKANLESALEEFRSHGSTVIFRVPPAIVTNDGGQWGVSGGHNRKEALPYFAQAMREVAEENDVLLVDHYQMFTDRFFADGSGFSSESQGGGWNANGIHPGTVGHLEMARQFLKDMQLMDDLDPFDTYEYVLAQSATQKTGWTPVVEGNVVKADIAALEQADQAEYGSVELSVTVNGQTWTKTVDRTSSASVGEISLEAGILQDGQAQISLMLWNKADLKTGASYSATADLIAKQSVDFTLLQLMCQAASQTLNNTALYSNSDSSMQALLQQTQAGQGLLENGQDQQEADQAARDLQALYLPLRLIPSSQAVSSLLS